MNAVIDLNSELLIDRSRIRNPYLRLLLSVLGEKLVEGSPWIAVDKTLAFEQESLIRLIERKIQHAAA